MQNVPLLQWKPSFKGRYVAAAIGEQHAKVARDAGKSEPDENKQEPTALDWPMTLPLESFREYADRRLRLSEFATPC